MQAGTKAVKHFESLGKSSTPALFLLFLFHVLYPVRVLALL